MWTLTLPMHNAPQHTIHWQAHGIKHRSEKEKEEHRAGHRVGENLVPLLQRQDSLRSLLATLGHAIAIAIAIAALHPRLASRQQS